jgi:enterochelin esterase family protein
VLSQSGALGGRGQSTAVFELIEGSEHHSVQVWMDAGKFEWLRLANEGMQDLLTSKGFDVTFREYSGGHNYTAWRNDLARDYRHSFDFHLR